MTTTSFKKAILNEVKNYEYASAIVKIKSIEEYTANGVQAGKTFAAIISVKEDKYAVKRWRVYYNYDLSMKNSIASMNFDTYSEAVDEFMKF